MRFWAWLGAVVIVAGCDKPDPPFQPVDLTPVYVSGCRQKWPSNRALRESCIASVKSVPHWSQDPKARKTIGDRCEEQFPGNPDLQLRCLNRVMNDDVEARIHTAERGAR